MNVSHAIEILKEAMKKEAIVQENGLGTELFLFVSTLTPIVNVDLLVFNERKEVLLAWRDDQFYGKGWHIPGSCIRFDETIDHAVQRCAVDELGRKVSYIKEPLRVYDLHSCGKDDALGVQRERKNTIALVFGCKLPEDFVVDNNGKLEADEGYLSWFNTLPYNFLKIHSCYRKDWDLLMKRFEEGKMEILRE